MEEEAGGMWEMVDERERKVESAGGGRETVDGDGKVAEEGWVI